MNKACIASTRNVRPIDNGGGSKLTWSQVDEIRSVAATTTKKKLAAKYRVSESTIRILLDGKTWKKVRQRTFMVRFWEKVDVLSDEECWEWTAAKTHGYGVIGDGNGRAGGLIRANRVALELKLGREIAEGAFACHSCDNRGCVNPAHMFEGSHRDNMEDMVLKDRQSSGASHGAKVKGRLSKKNRSDILEAGENGVSARSISIALGFDIRTVSRVMKGAQDGRNK